MAMYPTRCTECDDIVMSSALDVDDYVCGPCKREENPLREKLQEFDDDLCNLIVDYQRDSINRYNLQTDLHLLLDKLREIHGSL